MPMCRKSNAFDIYAKKRFTSELLFFTVTEIFYDINLNVFMLQFSSSLAIL